jgi:hexosaminidase
VTLDLERETAIRSVSVGFLHAPGAEIYAPSAFVILASDDGTNFKEVARQTFDGANAESCQTYTWKGRLRTRYLRIQAPAAAQGGWVFADEVIVK